MAPRAGASLDLGRGRWRDVGRRPASGYNPRRTTDVLSANASSLAQALKAEARRRGFELVGITSPDPPPHFTVYQNWLEAGRHGEMTYLATDRARARRRHPREILPECRSILVVGVNYLPEEIGASDRGKVAAYAVGNDYHEVIPKRLRAVTAWLEEQVGEPVPHRIYTDTGPILERDLAQRAGLGWIGKNTCLIHPRLGSYYLLGEALLGIELPADPPFAADLCGTCTRCLDACPTECILPDRTIDARRCISYLTIELKGPIPVDLRPALGDWIFGCDVCQQVCPWNLRFARPTADPDFQPREAVRSISAAGLLKIDPAGFRQAFRGSPALRARRRGLLRNAAVVAGNRGDASALPALQEALLNDREPLVRIHSAWALGRLGGEEARAALLRARAGEGVAEVREEIDAALGALRSGGAPPYEA
jgi:epoxyqueuosine reductase